MHSVYHRIHFTELKESTAHLEGRLRAKIRSIRMQNIEKDSQHDITFIESIARAMNSNINSSTTLIQSTYVPGGDTPNQLDIVDFSLLRENDTGRAMANRGRQILQVVDDMETRKVLGQQKFVRNADIKCSDIATLRTDKYIADDIINFMFDVFGNFVTNTLFLPAWFFDCMDDVPTDGKDSIFHFENVMIPIPSQSLSSVRETENIEIANRYGRGGHYFLQSICMKDRVIEVRDSFKRLCPELRPIAFGKIIGYLYKAHLKAGGAPIHFDDFASEWRLFDQSDHCPQQIFPDCGIFVVLNALILSQGKMVTSTTYSQDTIRNAQIRQRIAAFIQDRGGGFHNEYSAYHNEAMDRQQQHQLQRQHRSESDRGVEENRMEIESHNTTQEQYQTRRQQQQQYNDQTSSPSDTSTSSTIECKF